MAKAKGKASTTYDRLWSYPAIEQFIEGASQEEADNLFEPVRAGLKALKGPRADQAKKVGLAIDRTQELLHILIQTRENMVKKSKSKR